MSEHGAHIPLDQCAKPTISKSPETTLCSCSKCLIYFNCLVCCLSTHSSPSNYSPETRRHSPLGNGIRDRHYRSNVLLRSHFLHCPKEAIRKHLTACRALSRGPDVLFDTGVAEFHIPNRRHPSLRSFPRDGYSGKLLTWVHRLSAGAWRRHLCAGNLQTCSRSCVTLVGSGIRFSCQPLIGHGPTEQTSCSSD